MLGVTHLLYFGSIQLCGLPAPPVGGYRRLFALAPCGLVVSPSPIGDLILHGIIACQGRYRFCPLPRVSPYASQRRSPTRWMEFPQTSGPTAAPQLTTPLNHSLYDMFYSQTSFAFTNRFSLALSKIMSSIRCNPSISSGVVTGSRSYWIQLMK